MKYINSFDLMLRIDAYIRLNLYLLDDCDIDKLNNRYVVQAQHALDVLHGERYYNYYINALVYMLKHNIDLDTYRQEKRYEQLKKIDICKYC